MGVVEVSEDDVAPYLDLFGPQAEGDGLYGERLVHARGEVDRPDPDAGSAGAAPGNCCHAPTLLAPVGNGVRMGGRRPPAGQNSTLMNAPVSLKPTLT
ncbi:hypothetical protein GCM10009647_077530 [Streptomyces sanglieri]